MEYKILIFAPHFSLPASNGADILLVNRFVNLTEEGHQVTIFGSSAVYYFTSKSDYSAEPFFSQKRSSLRSALKAVLTQTDYLYCKFITKEIRVAITSHLASNSYDFIVASFLYSAIALSLLSSSEKYIPDYCELHNDDWNWNRTLLRISSNSSVRDHIRRLFLNIVLASSSRFFTDNITTKFSRSTFISLSQKDLDSVSRKIRYGKHICIPPGVPERSNLNHNQYLSLRADRDCSSLNLLFIGSLGCKMSLDAINFFFERFYIHFPDHLRCKCNLLVAGSNPSTRIYELSRKYSFHVFPNFPDSETDSLFIGSDFLIAPFPYTNGAKIKIFQALSYGLPIIGTNCVNPDDSCSFSSCLFSDDPCQWVDHLNHHKYLSLNVRYLLRCTLQNQSTSLNWTSRTEQLNSLLHANAL